MCTLSTGVRPSHHLQLFSRNGVPRPRGLYEEAVIYSEVSASRVPITQSFPSCQRGLPPCGHRAVYYSLYLLSILSLSFSTLSPAEPRSSSPFLPSGFQELYPSSPSSSATFVGTSNKSCYHAARILTQAVDPKPHRYVSRTLSHTDLLIHETDRPHDR